MINLWTMPWSTPTFAKTTLAPTIILMAPRKCQPSLSTLWSKHPLAHHPPFGPPQLLRDPSPLALLSLWWSSTKTTPLPFSTLPRASLPPFGKGSSRTPWPPWLSTIKYLTLNDGWTTIETRFHSRQVSDPRDTSLTMRPEYRTLLFRQGMGTINKHTGSNNWLKGKCVTGSWNEASLYASWTGVSSGTGRRYLSDSITVQFD
jgi:hypothetical protein